MTSTHGGGEADPTARTNFRPGSHDVVEPPVTGKHSASVPAKTSPVAAFALVFGLSGFIFALTGVLAPLALLFGIVGIVLGVIGRKQGANPLPNARGTVLTGKGVATGGLVLAIIALLIGIAVVIGAVTVLVNPTLLDSVQQSFRDLVTSVTG